MSQTFSQWDPVKRSPVHHKLVQLGAILEPISQWSCAMQFSDPEEEADAVRRNVGLLDLSFTSKWELKGQGVGQFLGSTLERPAPEPGGVASTDSSYAARISLDHALVVSDRGDDRIIARITDRNSRSECFHVTERSSGLGNFLVCGPRARALLGRLTSLDLRESSFANLQCRCGPVAATHATIIRRDPGSLAGYEILCHSEYAEYLWDCVVEAGEEFEMRPFGLTAHRLLGGSDA